MVYSKGPDYLDIHSPKMKTDERTFGNFMGPFLILAISLASVIGIYCLSRGFFSKSVNIAQVSTVSGATDDDLNKRQLTAFVERFLPLYYNYSYALYDQSVAKAEGMMTPAFQAAYNQRSEDLDFKLKLANLRVRTDGIKILPGSLAFSNDDDRFYVRLAGTMTFTTGINGVTGDFPLTLLLSAQKTDQGYLMDNVERLR
jgi:hypothetical protein